jgi:hypothetical protein
MLYLKEPDRALMHRLARWHPAYENLLPMLLAWDEPEIPRNWFCDDPTAPELVMVAVRNRLILLSGGGDARQALADLLAGNLEPADSWPDEAAFKQWHEDGSPRRRIGLTAHGLHAYDAALSLGFADVSEEQDSFGAYFLEISGKPRYASLVKHPCRVVDRGLELLELMKQATDYDESGEYTTLCLKHGPSFVCEVDGEPVCWSCTHINGTMGMIYTPKKLRRRGYALSLAAFQIDYMLRHHGLAACFVLAHNEPSLKMMASLGARRMKPPMYWRTLEWPATAG